MFAFFPPPRAGVGFPDVAAPPPTRAAPGARGGSPVPGYGLAHLGALICLVQAEAALRVMPLEANTGPVQPTPYVMRGRQGAATLATTATLSVRQLEVLLGVVSR